MRGLVDGAATSAPIAAGLPALFADDDFAQRLTGALDAVLAPAVGSLDNVRAYLDPGTAPPDFLRWLARWVAAPVDDLAGDECSTPMLRELVRAAAGLAARRGTAAALGEEVHHVTGVQVQVLDPGGVRWSSTPGCAPPGTAGAEVRVRVLPDAEAAPDAAPSPPAARSSARRPASRRAADPLLVRRLVRRSVPAHLAVTVTFPEED